ncbi:SAV_2336 N-terminal domain-related protein [Rhizobium phaseoli]|uniref:Response regulator CheY-like domain-containing protein n=1 Tax=Rhizobium phaseoli TaxID=396 RepID=A0ABN4QQT3_9HYPH|nr:SAV_2336 N-terminal domain-related protein [Rhizobium phaseoli]ANL87877.1 response regulator CheY-like domain-containing protein [Rhizobium phaseoli]ANL94386.1 response regulator CheY-like domain-containing protein [Rhizobium phaseoli]RDJ03642.1 hypothetical protein B5K05_28080 [Rhizobium phaseoli]
MILALVSALRAAGLTATIGELEQILWLAERLPAAGGDEAQPAERDQANPSAEATNQPRGDQPHAAAKESGGGKIADADAVETAATPLFAAQTQGSVSASVLQVPGVTMMSDLDGLRRALRPLSRRVPSRWRRTLDEEETASRAAETGIWYPFYRPTRERWLDLSIVIDGSPSMDLWADTVADFSRQLRSQGGFKSISNYSLPERPSAPMSPVVRGRGESIAHLLDRNKQHVVFLITDGTGFRWRDGSAQDFIRELGSCAAVSVVQLLPRRSWRHSRVGEPDFEVFAERPGDNNGRLKVVARGELDDTDITDLLFVPVIGLDTATLGQWARMLTARGGAAISGLAIPALPAPKSSIADAVPHSRNSLGDADVSAKAKVARYRHMASRSAYDLAVFMSVPDPLTVPVMRLVQRVMLPDTGIQELVEFFLGGLIEKQSGDGIVGEAVYRLANGVREELMRSLRYSEETKISTQLREIGEYLKNAEGSNFTAFFPSPTGRQRLTDWSLPFGTVSREVLHGGDLDGRSAERTTSRPSPGSLDSIDTVREPDVLNETERPNRTLLYTFASVSELSDLPAGVKILWVDDIPSNNIYPKDRFEEELDADCTIALSTAEGLELLTGAAAFDVIITDMGRPEGDEAGMDLFVAIRKMGIDIPVIIYAARWVTSARNRKRARDAGVFGTTNDAEELFRLVLEASPPTEARSFIRHYARTLADSDFFRQNHLSFLQFSPEEAAAQISSLNLGLDQIPHALVEFVSAISQSEYVQLFTLAPDHLPLLASVVAAGFATYEAASLDGLIGKAAKTGQLIWAPDVSKQRNYIKAERSTKSELVIPRTIGSETFVINIERAVSNAYSDAQIKWLSDFIHSFPFPGANQHAEESSRASLKTPRILVAGTGTFKLPVSVQLLAKELGRSLAENGMHLVAGGWPGVDHIVSRSFTDRLVELGLDPLGHFTQLLEPGQKSDFTIDGAHTIVVRDWALDSVNQADAVVMMGGLGGTYNIYKAAIANSKPIVPIAGSGGDAAKAASELESRGQLHLGIATGFSSMTVDNHIQARLAVDSVIDRVKRFTDPVAQERYRWMIVALLALSEGNSPARPTEDNAPIITHLLSLRDALPERTDAYGSHPIDVSTPDRAVEALETFAEQRPYLLIAIYFDLPLVDPVRPVELSIPAAIVEALMQANGFDLFKESFEAFVQDRELSRRHVAQLDLIARHSERLSKILLPWLDSIRRLNSEHDNISQQSYSDDFPTEAFEGRNSENINAARFSDWGVVIGINSFRELPPLAHSARDAEEFSDWLIDPRGGAIAYRNVRILTGEVSTNEIESSLYDVKSAAKEYAENNGKLRRIYVYISSHFKFDPELNSYSIITSDTSTDFNRGTLNISDVTRYLRDFEEIVIFVDAARQRQIFSEVQVTDVFDDLVSRYIDFQRTACLWMTGTGKEKSSNTSVLLAGLRGEALGEFDEITVDDLYRYVRERQRSQSKKSTEDEYPRLVAHNRGERLILGSAPARHNLFA